MNRRPPGLETDKTVQGFLQFKSAEGLSRSTIELYQRDLDRWLEYQGDMDISKGIVQAHDGFILVENRQSGGTIISISFPLE